MLKYIFHPHIEVLPNFAIEIAISPSLYIEESTLCSKNDEKLVYEIGVYSTLITDDIQHANKNL